jgi:hypothetical protein
MVAKIKFGIFLLIVAYGVWLAFNVEPMRPYSSWNCAGSKMPFCIQRVR